MVSYHTWLMSHITQRLQQRQRREVMVGYIPAIILGLGMLIGTALCLEEM